MVAVTSTGILGFGGYYIAPGTGAVVFSDHRPGMSKKDMIRGARAIMALVRDLKLPVIALASTAGDAALRHYGFVRDNDFYRLER